VPDGILRKITTGALYLPPLFPTVPMDQVCEALPSWAKLQFVFNVITGDGPSAGLAATKAAATTPEALELGLWQPAARKQVTDAVRSLIRIDRSWHCAP